jgi:hypothetical protein
MLPWQLKREIAEKMSKRREQEKGGETRRRNRRK